MTVGAAGKIRFAARKNSRVAYRINGAPGREPVVFLHDLLFTQSVFAAIETPGLVPDLRGHGASATLANQWYSLAELADDVAAILDAENAPSAHLVGHGLGGTIAFEFAKKHPGRSRSLTLIEPNLYAVLEKDLDRGARTLREERRTSDRAAGDAAYKQLVDKSLDGYLTPRFGADWRSRASKGRSGAIRRNAGALAGMLPALDSFTPSRADIERGAGRSDQRRPAGGLSSQRSDRIVRLQRSPQRPLRQRIRSLARPARRLDQRRPIEAPGVRPIWQPI